MIRLGLLCVLPIWSNHFYTCEFAQVIGVSVQNNGSIKALASNFQYLSAGRASWSYGNGVGHSRQYDQQYWLQSFNTLVLMSISYPQYDGNGNIERMVIDGTTNQFSYDALNRLETASGDFGYRQYDYDSVGNRTLLIADGVQTVYDYEARSNRIDCETLWDYELDANGNVIEKRASDGSGVRYTFTAHNRLESVTDLLAPATPIATYQYNALGQPTVKTVGEVETHFIYGLSGELLAEIDVAGNIIEEIVYLHGAPLALLGNSNSVAAAYHYVHNDHLGTPRKITVSAGQVVWQASYDPFGEVAVNDDVDGDGTSYSFNIRFPRQYFDAESGLHYNYFRDCGP